MLAGHGGPVVEFAIGTGRLALPLARRCLAIHGIDGSPEMTDLLQRKPGGKEIPVVIGDFSCHHRAMVNVTVEARNDVDNPGVVKLQGDTWELNIWGTTDQLWKLADIEKTDWTQRRTLQVGTCAHAPVWWNELDGTVYISVGHDDVTWDFGVTVPLATVNQLLAELGEPPEVPPPHFGPTLFLPAVDNHIRHYRVAWLWSSGPEVQPCHL